MSLEVQAWSETTSLYDLASGGSRIARVVRVRYRPEGKRRWTKFYIIPEEGQSVDDLLARAPETAEWHASDKRKDASR